MFNVVVEHRKRRVWTPRTIAISVGAHLLVLAAVVSAAKAEEREPVVVIPIDYPAEARPKPVKPTPPPPADPDRPAPVPGRRLELRAPETVPPDIPPADPATPPADEEDYNRDGPPGQVIGDPPATPPADTSADVDPLKDWRDGTIPAEYADQLPQLSNTRDAQRLLERAYPPTLRDAGVTGRTTVVLVIDKNGQVQPGSVEVRETTNDAFRDAAVRAAERFRFRPARLNGQPVSVIISLPIDWQIAP
jgi:protein TonB